MFARECIESSERMCTRALVRSIGNFPQAGGYCVSLCECMYVCTPMCIFALDILQICSNTFYLTELGPTSSCSSSGFSFCNLYYQSELQLSDLLFKHF